MQSDPTLVRRLEELCFNAWPALRTVLVGGWVVRLAEGHERRANGASPIHPSSLASEKIIDLVDEVFDRSGLEPVYRLTGLQPPGFEDSLRARGYVDQESLVTLRSPPLWGGRGDEMVSIADRVNDDWLRQALAAHGWETEIEPGLRRVFEDIVWPCGFATVRENERDVAWGLAVVEADHVGLFDLVVSPDCRNKGHGRRLLRSLLRWGRHQGAGRAYLQVRVDNEAGRGLYRSMGFAEIYGCRCFVRPSSAEAGPNGSA